MWRASTTLLFLFRAAAVYKENIRIRILFIVMWICTTTGFTVLAVRYTGGLFRIGDYCLLSYGPEALIAATAFEVVNETSMCLAIWYRLAGDKWKERRQNIKNILHPRRHYITDIVVQDAIIYSWCVLLEQFRKHSNDIPIGRR